MTLPPGPWTAEVMQQVVDAKVAEIRRGLKIKQRSVANAQVVRELAVVEARTPQAEEVPEKFLVSA